MLSLRDVWFVLPGLLIGLTLHEFFHAWAAKLLGDEYAASKGRLTLNPLAHLSPLGLLMVMFLGFGWAKPVPVNLYNLKNPRRDFLLISLAGPLANLLLLIFCVILIRVMPFHRENWLLLIFSGAYINGLLFVLNLLPIPPLDGSRIWPFLFPALKIRGSWSSWVWLFLLLLIIRLNLLDGLINTVLDVVAGLAGLK